MKKTLSNSFLIVGNTIGSGILALPLVTADFGFMVFTAGPHITHENLSYINFDGIYWIFAVAILCFAYTTIVPSLHAHCGTDKKLMLSRMFHTDPFLEGFL